MAIKTILLPLRRSDATEHLLETGMELAERFDAHVAVLYVKPRPAEVLPFATLGFSSHMRDEVLAAAERNVRSDADALRADFEAACAKRGLGVVDAEDRAGRAGASWTEAVGHRDEQIARHGRLADLVVVPRPSRTAPPPRSFEAAVRDTGRPVLMVPRQRSAAVTLDRIVIGWNGSKEAAQAVAAAGPCFAAAESVTVLCSSKRMRQHPQGDDVVTYLARHGVDAAVRVFEATGRGVGEQLLEGVRAVGGNLLVVGGYSRPRMREVVMGGVTGHLLRHADLPVLMVH